MAIRLHVFPTSWSINPSPFCLKAETYCTLAGVPFTRVHGLPLGAPRAKLPFIEHDGRRIPDSGLIIAYLKQHFGDPLDADLTPQQHALGHLLRRTCEESLYFYLVYSRWIDPAGWRTVKPVIFGGLPPVVRGAIAAVAQRSLRRALHAQGCGRHTRDEVYAMGAADLGAIAAMLGAHPFAVSERPTSYDASLYGLLANIVSVPVETELKAAALSLPPLTAYVARLRKALETMPAPP